MEEREIHLTKKIAHGYVIPAGPVNLVMARTGEGVIGCGLFDITVLDKFSFPAAKVRAATGPSIVTIDDLLAGIIKEVNTAAADRGVTLGMTGREALELF